MAENIRKVKRRDDAGIADIIRSAFVEYGLPRVHTVYDDDTTDRQYEVFRHPRSVLWVAENEGCVQGMCGVYPTDGLPDGWCEIVKFYVSLEARGKGIGRQLFGKALESAARLGYEVAYLETFTPLARAVGMYRSFGFTPVEHQVGNSGHTATDIWMTKRLNTK